MIERFEITAAELSRLVRECQQIHFEFTPVGARLVWNTTEPMPEAVQKLGLLRGVLNENCEGLGI